MLVRAIGLGDSHAIQGCIKRAVLSVIAQNQAVEMYGIAPTDCTVVDDKSRHLNNLTI